MSALTHQRIHVLSVPINHTAGFILALDTALPQLMRVLLNGENVCFFCKMGVAGVLHSFSCYAWRHVKCDQR